MKKESPNLSFGWDFQLSISTCFSFGSWNFLLKAQSDMLALAYQMLMVKVKMIKKSYVKILSSCVPKKIVKQMAGNEFREKTLRWMLVYFYNDV